MYERLYNSIAQQERYSYGGKVPSNFDEFTTPCQEYTNGTKFDFVGCYRQKETSIWLPSASVKADPPLIIQPTQLYYRHIGQMPYYGGHIPGSQLRYGKTYGTDTKDAKRWLRGDFTV